ncbi:MAG: sigma-70 family RNA polymerase sigma factor [Clostridiales bacterium]|jgi:RNA polymerase sigma factor (sigma-70 family)|nr:sigma-70 family RNA polymerase sigma factor [Clostridiales bacterium]
MNCCENKTFDDMYARYNKTVYKYVLVSLECNHDRADDCMQDIYAVLLQKTEEIMVHPNPGGFFIVTARNFIKKYKTAQAVNAVRCIPLEKTAPFLRYEEDFSIPEDVDEQLLKTEILRHLDDKEISLYTMFYEQKFSVAEISVRLRITEGNVKVRLYRLRLKVKNKVKEIFK